MARLTEDTILLKIMKSKKRLDYLNEINRTIVEAYQVFGKEAVIAYLEGYINSLRKLIKYEKNKSRK